MNRDFEEQLRRALCQVDPPEGFAERILERVDRRRSERRIWHSAIAAGLALLLSAGGIGMEYRRHEHRQAEQTKRQVVFALSLAAQKVGRVNARLQQSAPQLEVGGNEGGRL
jgi:hypothetical protein